MLQMIMMMMMINILLVQISPNISTSCLLQRLSTVMRIHGNDNDFVWSVSASLQVVVRLWSSIRSCTRLMQPSNVFVFVSICELKFLSVSFVHR